MEEGVVDDPWVRALVLSIKTRTGAVSNIPESFRLESREPVAPMEWVGDRDGCDMWFGII